MSFPAAAFAGEINYTVQGNGVAIITMNAPQRMNTLSSPMLRGLLHALEIAACDDGVQVVVLTGEGPRAFCAGGNLTPDSEDGAASVFKHSGVDGPQIAAVPQAIRQLRYDPALARTRCRCFWASPGVRPLHLQYQPLFAAAPGIDADDPFYSYAGVMIWSSVLVAVAAADNVVPP